MGKSHNTKSSPVRRITIDEKLTENLMRILVSELKPNTKVFNDDLSYWGEEQEILVQPDNFKAVTGMTRNNVEKWPWDSLYEGQTFLQGYFKAISDQRSFQTGARKWNFQCINDFIKNDAKQIYFSALKGGAGNG
jgi:hypothetical protein